MNTDTNLGRVIVRPAVSADAARLAEFGARLFLETFGADNTPEDMAIYLGRTYGAAQQTAELDDPAMTTIVAEADGLLAGYAQMRAGPAPESVEGHPPIELLRFYVDRAWQGRGLARTLMRAVDDEAARRGAAVLWLAVWERNGRAKAFYRKCGFDDVGSKVFVLGTDRQTDRVMARPLRSYPT
jgi:ribosomal protein S18 acetylase RimI-like enzyme